MFTLYAAFSRAFQRTQARLTEALGPTGAYLAIMSALFGVITVAALASAYLWPVDASVEGEVTQGLARIGQVLHIVIAGVDCLLVTLWCVYIRAHQKTATPIR